MKVILLKDVAKIGRKYDVVEVATGYALNKLIPSGLAETATAESLKVHNAGIKASIEAQETLEKNFAGIVDKLKEEPLVIKVIANEQGHLFEAVKPSTIVEYAESVGVELPADTITLAEPIKTTGKHDIMLSTGGPGETVTIEVVAE